MDKAEVNAKNLALNLKFLIAIIVIASVAATLVVIIGHKSQKTFLVDDNEKEVDCKSSQTASKIGDFKYCTNNKLFVFKDEPEAGVITLRDQVSKDLLEEQIKNDSPGYDQNYSFMTISIKSTKDFKNPEGISKTDFFDGSSSYWIVGENLGGGPGITFYKPEKKIYGANQFMYQLSHYSTKYEWVSPKEQFESYYLYVNQETVLNITFYYHKENDRLPELKSYLDQLLSSVKYLGTD